MTAVEFAALTDPLSEAEPCGPDLELTGDAEYMNFVARAEGLLPASYFRDGRPFDRASIDFESVFEAIRPLLARTRDIRLLTILAKFSILNRDLASFETAIRAVAALLAQQWDDVHPRGEDGDFNIRLATLETLDDVPPVVMPLQYLPLADHRRFGVVTYRGYLVATGEQKAREGEEAPDFATVGNALMEASLPDLTDVWRRFGNLQTAVTTIRDVCAEHAGPGAVSLEKLLQLTDRILALLDSVVAKRDPNAAKLVEMAGLAGALNEQPGAAPVAPPAPSAAAPPRPSGRVASAADAASALAAVSRYLDRFEPSNPALLLVRQAEQLIGKSLLEVMRILVPDFVDQAAIKVGKGQVFKLPIEKLSLLASPGDSGRSDTAMVDTGNGQAGGAPATDAASPSGSMVVSTRREAVGLLGEVGAYYRLAEPSSPVAVLMEGARELAERDFLSLLKELLPEAALKPGGSDM